MGDTVQMNAARVRIPSWLCYSLLTIVLWGAWGVQSKLITDRISPWMNQVLFPLGLAPVVAWLAFTGRLQSGTCERHGAGWAFFTGVLGGAGNVAFYLALRRGGSVAVVVPLTCLFPLVTVATAYLVLHERLTAPQWGGLALALVAIYLLSA
jgi:transporter family protein